MHALSSNVVPALEFVKAIPNMQPSDVLEILPALLSQIPTQKARTLRLQILFKVF